MAAPEISHGRGGAGNINPDNTEYVDGEIVRQGDLGTHGDGAYSTGRGGAANIADKDQPTAPSRLDNDFVPSEAVRPSTDGDVHTGRGGAANVAHVKGETDTNKPGHPHHRGLADKLKDKVFGVFKK